MCSCLFRRRIRGGHHSFDSTADREITDDGHPSRRARGDEIIEDLVGDRFVEDPAIAKADHVVLQRFQLDTAIARHVADADFAEVWKAGLRAHRGELGKVDGDFEIALGTRIRECLQRSRA